MYNRREDCDVVENITPESSRNDGIDNSAGDQVSQESDEEKRGLKKIDKDHVHFVFL